MSLHDASCYDFGTMKFLSLLKGKVREHTRRFSLGAAMLCSCFCAGAAGQGQTIGSAADLTSELRTKIDKLSSLQKKFQQDHEYERSGRDAFSEGD